MQPGGDGFKKPFSVRAGKRSLSTTHCTSRRGFALAERMHDEADHCDADAGVGDVKGRPGIREGDVQIEKQKVDHMPVQQAVGEIAHHAGEKER